MLRDNTFEFMKLPAQHAIIRTNLMRSTLQDFIVLKTLLVIRVN